MRKYPTISNHKNVFTIERIKDKIIILWIKIYLLHVQNYSYLIHMRVTYIPTPIYEHICCVKIVLNNV